MLTHAQTVTHRSLAFARAPTFTLSLMHTMRTRKEEEGGRRRKAEEEEEEDWLSSLCTLQAAACLGKPDAFLPAGRGARCHLKGSLLLPIHRRLRG